MTRAIVSLKYPLLTVLVLLLNGCVESQTRIESLGLAVGDRVSFKSELITYDCTPDVTVGGLWSGKATKASCLAEKPGARFAHEPGEQPYAGAETLQVEKIVYRNGIDSSFHWILLKEILGGTTHWIADYDAVGLFKKRATP